MSLMFALAVTNMDTQEMLDVIVYIFDDLGLTKCTSESLTVLRSLALRATKLVEARNQYVLAGFLDDQDCIVALEMVAFKLLVSLFSEYVGVPEVS